MTILVSPTEPVALRQAGTVSMWPETVGCDVVVFAGGRKIGVQRKEVKDLIASLEDKEGRLAKQVAQMQGSVLDERVVLVEGVMEFTGTGAGGVMVGRWRGGRQWTRGAIQAVEWDVRSRGVHVAYTENLAETVSWVKVTEKWWGKGGGRALSRRPKAPTVWGSAMNHEWGSWLLQAFPGIGPELAARIIRTFGRLPVRWDVSAEDLSRVEGVSRVRAQKWWETLNGEQGKG